MDADLMDAHEQWYSAITPAEQPRLEALLRKVAGSFESSVDD